MEAEVALAVEVKKKSLYRWEKNNSMNEWEWMPAGALFWAV